MMMDYYQWVDPFAEIDRANQRAAYAREDGRNDVLKFEYRNPGLIQRAIEDQAYRLADRVVTEQIQPRLADALNAQRVKAATLEVLSFTPLRHIVSQVDGKLASRPVYDAIDPDFGVMTTVQMKPFHYAISERLA